MPVGTRPRSPPCLQPLWPPVFHRDQQPFPPGLAGPFPARLPNPVGPQNSLCCTPRSGRGPHTSSRQHHPWASPGPRRDTGRPCGTRILARHHVMPLGRCWGRSGRVSGPCLTIIGSGLCCSGGCELRQATGYQQVRMWVWFRDTQVCGSGLPHLAQGPCRTVRSS